MKLIHSADWQLGARFEQFIPLSEQLRQARLATFQKALRLAQDEKADAFLIAGDLFEDNQVDDSMVKAVLSLFQEYSAVRIFIVPGNHDPQCGPNSVWNRDLFRECPSHVTIFREPSVIEHRGAYFLGAPLQQKVSTRDPSLKLAELASALASDKIRIGLTHGSLAIPGKHQAHDFPIDLHAATRAGLDYLAVGHWHNWQVYDEGRLVMPGTPEPDQFDQSESGYVADIRIDQRLAPPAMTRRPVASLHWHILTFNLLSAEDSKLRLAQQLNDWRNHAEHTVLRVVLEGCAHPEAIAAARSWIKQALGDFPLSQLVDCSAVAISEAELAQIRHEHPLAAQALLDLDVLESRITGAPLSPGPSETAIPINEAQRLAAESRIDLLNWKQTHFSQARQLLLQALQKAQQNGAPA